MVNKHDIRAAEFGEMRVNKEKVIAQVRKWGGGCTRSSLGRVKTQEEFEADKKRILGRVMAVLGGIRPE